MRRNWIKLYVDQTLRGTCFIELLPDERFIWFGFLLLAGDNAMEGKICVTEEMGFSNKQLASLLKCDTELINRSIKKMIKHEKIKVSKNNMIQILNWKKYQSEYQRQKKYRKEHKKRKDKELQHKVTSKSDNAKCGIERDIDIEEERERDKDKNNKYSKKDQSIIDKLYKKEPEEEYKRRNKKYIHILDFWNSKKIIKHKLTDNLIEEIKKAYKKYGKDKIIQAIKNYSIIHSDEDYFYTHIWRLDKFLKQKNGLPEFLEKGSVWINYIDKNKPVKKPEYFKAEDDEKSTPMPPEFRKKMDKALKKIEAKSKNFNG